MLRLVPFTPKPLSRAVLAVGAAVAFTAVMAGAWLVPRPANATAAYASQTKLSCGRCHVSPAGGGPTTAFGQAFAANGHKLPAKGASKGKNSTAAPVETTVVETAPAVRGQDIGNPGVVFTGPSPGPALYGVRNR
jgi:hypothetical protein